MKFDPKRLFTAAMAGLAAFVQLMPTLPLSADVRAWLTVVLVVGAAIGRSVWPDAKLPSTGKGLTGLSVLALVLPAALLAGCGGGLSRQAKIDRAIATACQSAVVGLHLAEGARVACDLVDDDQRRAQCVARAELAIHSAALAAQQCDPASPPTAPSTPSQETGPGAPPPDPPKVPEAPAQAAVPSRPGIPCAHLAAPRSRSGRVRDLRDCRRVGEG